MPESRLQKTRATLPEGYQFGDGGKPRLTRRYTDDFSQTFCIGDTITIKPRRWTRQQAEWVVGPD